MCADTCQQQRQSSAVFPQRDDTAIRLLQGSQRELKLLGRQQINLLNLWTKAMAQKVVSAIETSPAAQNSLITLAAAEAPFADPFLMEFEDPEALKNAYTEAPITFEQALITARLEAKMATQVRQLSSLSGYIPNGSSAEVRALRYACSERCAFADRVTGQDALYGELRAHRLPFGWILKQTHHIPMLIPLLLHTGWGPGPGAQRGTHKPAHARAAGLVGHRHHGDLCCFWV